MNGKIDKSNEQMVNQVVSLSVTIFNTIKTAISVPNFRQKSSQRRQLESAIRDELEYSGIESLKQNALKLTNELINLAEKRENEVRNS